MRKSIGLALILALITYVFPSPVYAQEYAESNGGGAKKVAVEVLNWAPLALSFTPIGNVARVLLNMAMPQVSAMVFRQTPARHYQPKITKINTKGAVLNPPTKAQAEAACNRPYKRCEVPDGPLQTVSLTIFAEIPPFTGGDVGDFVRRNGLRVGSAKDLGLVDLEFQNEFVGQAGVKDISVPTTLFVYRDLGNNKQILYLADCQIRIKGKETPWLNRIVLLDPPKPPVVEVRNPNPPADPGPQQSDPRDPSTIRLELGSGTPIQVHVDGLQANPAPQPTSAPQNVNVNVTHVYRNETPETFAGKFKKIGTGGGVAALGAAGIIAATKLDDIGAEAAKINRDRDIQVANINKESAVEAAKATPPTQINLVGVNNPVNNNNPGFFNDPVNSAVAAGFGGTGGAGGNGFGGAGGAGGVGQGGSATANANPTATANAGAGANATANPVPPPPPVHENGGPHNPPPPSDGGDHNPPVPSVTTDGGPHDPPPPPTVDPGPDHHWPPVNPPVVDPAVNTAEQPDQTHHGNNGPGNGSADPQPAGNPPINDGPNTGPGSPGNKGGAKKGLLVDNTGAKLVPID